MRDYRIVSEPSEEDLRPTDAEKREIQELLDWEEDSLRRDWPVPVALPGYRR